MNIKNRIEKLEQGQKPNKLVVIAVDDNETNEEAYQRRFPDGSIKPKTVIYLTPEDIDL